MDGKELELEIPGLASELHFSATGIADVVFWFSMSGLMSRSKAYSYLLPRSLASPTPCSAHKAGRPAALS